MKNDPEKAILECDTALVTDYFDIYIRDGFSNIEGWPGSKISVEFMKEFRDLFLRFGEEGGVCEIGVHHAKYLIALHNVLGSSKSLGLDLFEEQESNIDNYGRGAYNICKTNIDKFAQNPHFIDLRRMDSLTIKEKEKREILDEFGLFSMFSIDGGHTDLHVAVDFLTASDLTSRNGIIILDDIFHPDWPGVTEGIYRVLDSRISPFVPLMITRKKLFLCSASRQRLFVDFVLSKRNEFILKKETKVLIKSVEFGKWEIPSLNFGGEY